MAWISVQPPAVGFGVLGNRRTWRGEAPGVGLGPPPPWLGGVGAGASAEQAIWNATSAIPRSVRAFRRMSGLPLTNGPGKRRRITGGEYQRPARGLTLHPLTRGRVAEERDLKTHL